MAIHPLQLPASVSPPDWQAPATMSRLAIQLAARSIWRRIQCRRLLHSIGSLSIVSARPCKQIMEKTTKPTPPSLFPLLPLQPGTRSLWLMQLERGCADTTSGHACMHAPIKPETEHNRTQPNPTQRNQTKQNSDRTHICSTHTQHRGDRKSSPRRAEPGAGPSRRRSIRFR